MSLTDKAIRAFKPATKPYKKFDQKGLYLLIHPNGSKYWRYKYLFNDKENVLPLGVYPEVSLLEAREKTLSARKQLSNNLNPSQERKLEKLRVQMSSENTFEAIALEWHSNQQEIWTERHCKYILARLKDNAFPRIGNRPIREITAPELLMVLRNIEQRGAVDIARRILQMSGQIFRYAIATGRAERDISRDLKGALKARKQTHYKNLSETELPQFLYDLEHYDGDNLTRLGLKLLLLTFVRTIEIRGAKWHEFDFEAKIWRIPAERMKMRVPHVVPLSQDALNILKELKAFSSSEYLFPNRNNRKKGMSENTLLYALYRMGYHNSATVHGLRATASTILNENGFHSDAIERQLAHGEKNKVRASYNHAQYLKERREIMNWWAKYLSNARKSMEVHKKKIAA